MSLNTSHSSPTLKASELSEADSVTSPSLSPKYPQLWHSIVPVLLFMGVSFYWGGV